MNADAVNVRVSILERTKEKGMHSDVVNAVISRMGR